MLFSPICAVGGVTSPITLDEYPVPTVPECEPVSESYFINAMLIGDSLASGITLYDAMPELEVVYKIGLSPRAIAMGLRELKLDDAECTVPEYLEYHQPSVLYIWLGLNGVEGSGSKMVLENYDAMLNMIIDVLPNTLIYLIELTPVRPFAAEKKPMLTNANVNRFNTGLRKLAEEHNVYLLPIHNLYTNKYGEMHTSYAAGDGYHLRANGYTVLRDYLYSHAIPQDALPSVDAYELNNAAEGLSDVFEDLN
jgi:hypothetical protein